MQAGGRRNEASHSLVYGLRFVSDGGGGKRLPHATSLNSRVDSSTHRYPSHPPHSKTCPKPFWHIGTNPVLNPRRLAALSVCHAFVHLFLHPDPGHSFLSGTFDNQRGFKGSNQQVLVLLLLTGGGPAFPSLSRT